MTFRSYTKREQKLMVFAGLWHLENGFSLNAAASRLGVAQSTLTRWIVRWVDANPDCDRKKLGSHGYAWTLALQRGATSYVRRR